jgi:hypothetical protein
MRMASSRSALVVQTIFPSLEPSFASFSQMTPSSFALATVSALVPLEEAQLANATDNSTRKYCL